jgi:OmpA-OmpF porin, OOP family
MLSLEDKSMKMSRIALAMLVAAPLAAANAGVTVTPLLLGYTFQDSLKDYNNKHAGQTGQELKLKDDVFVGAALGVELTPWLGFEAEYSQVKGDLEARVAGTGADFQKNGKYKQSNIAGNFYVTSDLITKNYDSKIKPYVLLGAGHVKVTGEDGASFDKEEGTLGNAGIGAFWRLNDALSLRTEARATYNEAVKNWDYTALAGLNVVLGGHLKPAAPVVVVEPVVVETPVIVEPVVVAPVEVEDLQMELRVFFDTNKSNIKPQYQPEIAKVAEKLVEFPNATARIDGHTDNTGPLALNERLSLARANSVKSALVNEYNIDPARLTTKGFAWFQPIADNNTKEGRAMNRRVFATISGSRVVAE